MVAVAGLEACLEEGFGAAFLFVALEAVLLLSGVFFAFEAGVFEAGFFPITSCCGVRNMAIYAANKTRAPS